jgi:hypothetical protein
MEKPGERVLNGGEARRGVAPVKTTTTGTLFASLF